jgi:hypothetical protein
MTMAAVAARTADSDRRRVRRARNTADDLDQPVPAQRILTGGVDELGGETCQDRSASLADAVVDDLGDRGEQRVHTLRPVGVRLPGQPRDVLHDACAVLAVAVRAPPEHRRELPCRR